MQLYTKMKNNYFLWPLAIVFVVLPFLVALVSNGFSGVENILEGIANICKSQGILFTDYLLIGGLGATVVNVGLILMLNLTLLKINKAQVNGAFFAAIVFVLGFSFFGNDIVNVLPFYVGAYIYTKVKKIEYRRVLAIAMFSTGLSPFVSYIWYVNEFMTLNSFLLGTIVGMVIGFISPIFSAYAPRFHNGLQLYNMGFTCGVMAFIIYPMLEYFGVPKITSAVLLLNNSYSTTIYIGVLLVSTVFIISGFSKENLRNYLDLIKETGHGNNYHEMYGIEVTHLNIGILGYFCCLVLMIFGIQLNGPIVGALICVLSFATFGKNLRNVSYVMLGVIIGSFLLTGKAINNDPTNVGVVTALLFVTGIAPIGGKYGLFAGIFAGIFHLAIVLRTGATGGFLNLYNNGFAGGFVAFLFYCVFDNFNFKKD